MLSMIAGTLVAVAPVVPASPMVGPSAWVMATIDQSEWCPAGNVRLDLVTGAYRVTRGAARSVCEQPTLQRPVRTDRLTAEPLRALQAAYRRAVRDGLTSAACQPGGKPDDKMIVVSNGGPHILVINTGNMTLAAPDDLSCWSEGAADLHAALRHAFE